MLVDFTHCPLPNFKFAILFLWSIISAVIHWCASVGHFKLNAKPTRTMMPV